MSEHQEYGVSRHRERGLMRVGVIALIAVVLLGFGGMAIQQSAWSQGYVAGLVAGGDGGDALAQYVLYNSRSAGRLPGFGIFLILGMGFFFLLSAGKFMRMRAWRMAGGPEGGEGQRPWRGGPPPWAAHWQRHCGESQAQPRTPEPEAGAVPAETSGVTNDESLQAEV